MSRLLRGFDWRQAARVAVLGVGCVHPALAAPPQSGKSPSWIAPDESIVILESPQFHFDWDHRRLPLHIDLYRCATKSLHAKYPRVRLITQDTFVKQAFPNLEPSAAPISPDSLKLLADNPTFRERIAALNLRYLVYGGTEQDIETAWDMFGCAGGAYGAACWGGAAWKKRSSYNALVIDFKRRREFASGGAASGTTWFATVLPLFVGWKSPTEAHACTSLGQDVLALLDGAPVDGDASDPGQSP